jgi:hypothetical protein
MDTGWSPVLPLIKEAIENVSMSLSDKRFAFPWANAYEWTVCV